MVQVIKGKDVTLLQLQENFGLERTSDANFFREWQEDLPELNDFDQQCLDEVKQDFLYLSYYPMLEEVVKMTVLSPLLRRAGFYRPPFRLAAEEQVEIVSSDEGTLVRGRIDILILEPHLWTLAIEAKQGDYSLRVGLPQALFYMLAHPEPEKPAFGFVTNGGELIFLKLSKQETKYAMSDLFAIDRGDDIYTVVRILKHLGQIVANHQ